MTLNASFQPLLARLEEIDRGLGGDEDREYKNSLHFRSTASVVGPQPREGHQK